MLVLALLAAFAIAFLVSGAVPLALGLARLGSGHLAAALPSPETEHRCDCSQQHATAQSRGCDTPGHHFEMLTHADSPYGAMLVETSLPLAAAINRGLVQDEFTSSKGSECCGGAGGSSDDAEHEEKGDQANERKNTCHHVRDIPAQLQLARNGKEVVHILQGVVDRPVVPDRDQHRQRARAD
jgi:hypothetical protein